MRALLPLFLYVLELAIVNTAHAVTCTNSSPPTNPDSAYTIHGDGTATDNRTGLMWKVCAEGQNWISSSCVDSAAIMNPSNASRLADSTVYAGHTDWRLPNLNELQSLVEGCRTYPSINDSVFPSTPSSDFWSDSPFAGCSNCTWLVNFGYGGAGYGGYTYFTYVRLVRDSTSSQGRYTKVANNGNDLPSSATLGNGASDWACTRDNTTGLIWEVKTSDGGLRDWNKGYTNFDDINQPQWGAGTPYRNPTQLEVDAPTNSIGFVNSVNTTGLCGATNWRRPTFSELWNLIVYPAPVEGGATIDANFFPNTSISRVYWTGTPNTSAVQNASAINFVYAQSSSYYIRSWALALRLVHDNQPTSPYGTINFAIQSPGYAVPSQLVYVTLRGSNLPDDLILVTGNSASPAEYIPGCKTLFPQPGGTSGERVFACNPSGETNLGNNLTGQAFRLFAYSPSKGAIEQGNLGISFVGVKNVAISPAPLAGRPFQLQVAGTAVPSSAKVYFAGCELTQVGSSSTYLSDGCEPSAPGTYQVQVKYENMSVFLGNLLVSAANVTRTGVAATPDTIRIGQQAQIISQPDGGLADGCVLSDNTVGSIANGMFTAVRPGTTSVLCGAYSSTIRVLPGQKRDINLTILNRATSIATAYLLPTGINTYGGLETRVLVDGSSESVKTGAKATVIAPASGNGYIQFAPDPGFNGMVQFNYLVLNKTAEASATGAGTTYKVGEGKIALTVFGPPAVDPATQTVTIAINTPGAKANTVALTKLNETDFKVDSFTPMSGAGALLPVSGVGKPEVTNFLAGDYIGTASQTIDNNDDTILTTNHLSVAADKRNFKVIGGEVWDTITQPFTVKLKVDIPTSPFEFWATYFGMAAEAMAGVMSNTAGVFNQHVELFLPDCVGTVVDNNYPANNWDCSSLEGEEYEATNQVNDLLTHQTKGLIARTKRHLNTPGISSNLADSLGNVASTLTAIKNTWDGVSGLRGLVDMGDTISSMQDAFKAGKRVFNNRVLGLSGSFDEWEDFAQYALEAKLVFKSTDALNKINDQVVNTVDTWKVLQSILAVAQKQTLEDALSKEDTKTLLIQDMLVDLMRAKAEKITTYIPFHGITAIGETVKEPFLDRLADMEVWTMEPSWCIFGPCPWKKVLTTGKVRYADFYSTKAQ